MIGLTYFPTEEPSPSQAAAFRELSSIREDWKLHSIEYSGTIKPNKSEISSYVPFEMGEQRADSLWYPHADIYAGVTKRGSRVTVGYFNGWTASEMIRHECEFLLLLEKSDIAPRLEFCSPVSATMGVIAVDEIGVGVLHDLNQRKEMRYNLVETFYISIRMLEKVDRLLWEFGFLHPNLNLHSWNYRFIKSGYDAKNDDIVLSGFGKDTIFWPTAKRTASLQSTPRNALMQIIENIALLFSGSDIAMTPRGEFQFISGHFGANDKTPFNPITEFNLTKESYDEVYDNLRNVSSIYKNTDVYEIPNFQGVISLLKRNIEILESA